MKNKCGYSKKDLQLIRSFIKEIDKNIKVRISPAGNFECQLTIGKLNIGNKKMDKKQRVLWQEWYEQQEFYVGKVNKRMISLLHEIGHFQTFNFEEYALRNSQEYILIEEYCKGTLSEKELNFAYWNMTNEYKATKWAIEYYRNNRNRCEELAAILNFK